MTKKPRCVQGAGTCLGQDWHLVRPLVGRRGTVVLQTGRG